MVSIFIIRYLAKTLESTGYEGNFCLYLYDTWQLHTSLFRAFLADIKSLFARTFCVDYQ